MGRIRTVKPEFFTHGDLYDAEVEFNLPLRIAFAGMWCQADREGRFKWKPRELKTQVLPYDLCDFSRVLDALATRGFIVKYEHEGQQFGMIPSWTTHQFINNREQQSNLPKPTVFIDIDASPTREERVGHVKTTRVVKEGKGREGDGRVNNATKPILPEYISEELWGAFVESRIAAKKPFTTLHAQELAIKSLAKHREAGYDTTAIIEKSIERGWMGFVVNEETPKLKKVYRIMTPEESRASLLEGMTQ